MRPQLPGILTRGAMLPQMESPNSAVVGATACMGGLVIPSDAWTLSGMYFCRRGVLILGRLAAADAGQLHFQLALLTTLAGALQCLFLISSRARHTCATSAELQLPFLAAAMALRMRLVQNSLPAPIFCVCRHGWHIRARGTRKAIKAGVEGSRWQVPVRAGGRPRGCMRVPRSTARESCRPNIPPWGEALRSHGRQTSFQTCRGRACFGRRLAQSWRRQQPLQVRVCSNMRVVLVVAETAFRGGIKNLCPVGGRSESTPWSWSRGSCNPIPDRPHLRSLFLRASTPPAYRSWPQPGWPAGWPGWGRRSPNVLWAWWLASTEARQEIVVAVKSVQGRGNQGVRKMPTIETRDLK